jgi:hypothetical protein
MAVLALEPYADGESDTGRALRGTSRTNGDPLKALRVP